MEKQNLHPIIFIYKCILCGKRLDGRVWHNNSWMPEEDVLDTSRYSACEEVYMQENVILVEISPDEEVKSFLLNERFYRFEFSEDEIPQDRVVRVETDRLDSLVDKYKLKNF